MARKRSNGNDAALVAAKAALIISGALLGALFGAWVGWRVGSIFNNIAIHNRFFIAAVLTGAFVGTLWAWWYVSGEVWRD